jgi:hypothetical protein
MRLGIQQAAIVGQASAFPIPTAGLFSMLYGGDSLYTDLGKTTLATLDQPIAVWADRSGNGNDWIQANASYRPKAEPTYGYGGDGINVGRIKNEGFATGGPSFHLTGPNISSWTAGTFAARLWVNGAHQGCVWGTTSLNSPNTAGHWNYSGVHYMNFGNTVQRSAGAQPQNTWVTYIQEISASGAMRTFLNNVQIQSSTGETVGFRSVPYLGGGVRGGTIQYCIWAYYAKFCCYNRVLSSDERGSVHTWLTT